MRRFFLPILVCALWLASLAGGGWVRAECVRACAAQAQAQVEEVVPACCAKHAHSAKKSSVGCCTSTQCPKCQALAKALLSVGPLADAPLFFDTACGVAQPVMERSFAPLFVPTRSWRWSLPPPDTLLGLRCQLMM